MPHISEAMQRSVRRGALDKVGGIVVRSLLGKRGITDEVSSVKNSFSSWDNCMAATYCKWPVIIGIIVGGLIIFSVLWCIIRCACCGMSCCCTCFSFLKCCDCCGGCCDGKKDKPHKHLDQYNSPPRDQGYQAPAPMMGGGLSAPAAGPPQYAQFEVGKNGLAVTPTPLSEDALPPMPSWESASKKRVLDDDEKDGMEMSALEPSTGQKVPLIGGAASPGGLSHGGASPMEGQSPFGAHPGQGGQNGYMGVGGASPVDAYGQNQNAFNQNGRGFGGPQNGPGMGGPQDRYGSPAPQGMNRGYGSPAPQQMGRGYGPNSPQDMYGNTTPGGYARPPPQRQFSNDSYGPNGPQRQYSGSSARPYQDNQYGNAMPPPTRGPSRGPGGPGRMASPPLNNNSGFDFGGQQQQYGGRPSPPPQEYGQQQYDEPQQYNSRPSPPPLQMPFGGPPPGARSTPRLEQQQSGNQRGYFDQPAGGSTAPPSYASRSPPPQEQATYPGYRPYQPPAQSQQGPPQALTPGGGGRQPDRWDPVSH